MYQFNFSRMVEEVLLLKKNIFAIIGSASQNSSNERLVESLACKMRDDFNVTIFNGLKTLPHFDPEQSLEKVPRIIEVFRESINRADGVIICTPEYVFSIPSGLKNAIEWCVASTVFSDKPVGLITASAQGRKGHEELQLLMKTVMARFTDETTLLIQGIKGKINLDGEIVDESTKDEMVRFAGAYKCLIKTG